MPPRLLVIGAGYISLELGQGLARLGSKTHMIVRGSRVLDREEPDVSETLAEALKQDGIQIHFNVNTEKVIYANDVFTLKLDNGKELQGEALLVATGRKPNTSALNVAATGVELDEKGYIKIDD